MATLEHLLAQRSAESRERIAARADEIRQEIALAKIREELNISQKQLADAMGIKQPAVAKMEKVDNDPKLSTLKRYVKALGGELSLDVTLPDGKRIALHL
ncbi:helix-turn-helix domain-containing protein [Serratia odorifera]|jgi:predicted transcriptional regulator|uniref:DNA-binding helix-turn-helix protein n=2 Tax=Serratia odorifera TaxID=618 RepID=D4DZY8_SEROD|nr:helix-turn-helix domain-containing protein [Serratia odorifera]EFE96894.1 DNA-binding helix-turn-helix protein [Serratia odorifera DSM 4582]MBJ2066289.1 helix-turn-helix domain-containing protein [Serratia odorifera]PNK91419.1 transcriptional regulator [Serratia odorifera]RII72492.1 helix-turn-helix domain-containing protein [Serratia odorifera]VDZ55853.1 Antitoxin HigA [Serratia odorifera]